MEKEVYSVATRIEPNLKLLPAKPEDVKKREQFHWLVGRLIYLSHISPDIAFAVSMVSQFMHSLGPEHFEAAYRIIWYLKGSPWRGLLFEKHGHLQIEVYTDAYSRSSAEAELRSVAHGICEMLWIKRILDELKISCYSPIKAYCDNKVAISIAHNPVLHDRTKHVEVDKHFIKEKIDNRQICTTYIPIDDQIEDVLS